MVNIHKANMLNPLNSYKNITVLLIRRVGKWIKTDKLKKKLLKIDKINKTGESIKIYFQAFLRITLKYCCTAA